MSEAEDEIFVPFENNVEDVFASRREPDVTTAIVVPDANVLLAPYETSGKALAAIRETYSRLKVENRLLLPAQVAREFAGRRSDLLAALYKSVVDAPSKLQVPQIDFAPILSEEPTFLQAQKELKAAR